MFIREFFWAISEKNQRINIYLSKKWIIYFLLSSKNGILLISENWLDREEWDEEKNLIAKTDKEKKERERGNTFLRWKSKFNFEEEKKKDYELETELYKQIRIQDPTLEMGITAEI